MLLQLISFSNSGNFFFLLKSFQFMQFFRLLKSFQLTQFFRLSKSLGLQLFLDPLNIVSLSVSRSAGSFLSYTAFLPAAFFRLELPCPIFPALVFLPVSGCWPGEWFLPFSELPSWCLFLFFRLCQVHKMALRHLQLFISRRFRLYISFCILICIFEIVETVLPSGSNLLSGNLFPAGVLFLSVFGIQSAILLSVPADEFSDSICLSFSDCGSPSGCS